MGEIFNERKRRRLLLAVLILCIGLFYAGLYRSGGLESLMTSESSSKEETDGSEDEASEDISSDEEGTEESAGSETLLAVHVSGAVEDPDQIFYLEEGSRVIDAIEAAGGATDEADVSQLNLAEKIYDGEKIYVPVYGEETDSSLTSGSSAEVSADKETLININTATAEELETLPGIGEVYAERIITYREENGDFESVEDIQNVSGIGEATYEKLKDLITV